MCLSVCRPGVCQCRDLCAKPIFWVIILFMSSLAFQKMLQRGIFKFFNKLCLPKQPGFLPILWGDSPPLHPLPLSAIILCYFMLGQTIKPSCCLALSLLCIIVPNN